MGKRERREMGGWLDLAKFMGAEKDGHTVEKNDTVGNGGDVGPFVLEIENSKKNGRGDIPSVAELSPKGLSRFATKEWNLTNGKEHSVIESEKKELAVGSGGDDNHTVEEKVPTELPGCTVNELKLTIEKEHSVVNVIEHLLTTEAHEQVMENEEDDPEEAPTGSPGFAAEENETRNEHPIDGEDSTRKDNNHQGTSRIVKGQGQETNVKNRIEQYLIGTSRTSTPSRTSGGGYG